MATDDRAEYPKYVEHYGIHAVVQSAEDEATFMSLPEPPAHAQKQKNIDALVQGRREAETAAQVEIDNWKAQDEALQAKRADILSRHEAGREAADARMTTLGGTWPDDMVKAETSYRVAKAARGAKPSTVAPDTANVEKPPSALGHPELVSNNPAVAANPVPDAVKTGDIATGGADTSNPTGFVPPATT